MQKLVSIVIPIYNVEKYLERCIQSVVKQTYKDIEIILVNDGSTDESGKICEKWKKEDSRIQVINKKNGGLSEARNFGIDIAKGDYICFVDSDDFIENVMIEKLIKINEEREADIAICNRFYYYENNDKYLRFRDENEIMEMNSEEAIKEMVLLKNFDMAAWGKLYKTELFKNIRFPVKKLSEDYYIMYKLFDIAGKVVYTSKPYYYYLQRKGSISKTPKLNYDFIEAAKLQMDYVEKKYPNLKTYVRAAYASSNMTVYNIMLDYNAKIKKEDIIKLKSIVKQNNKYIFACNEWKALKKIQAFLFAECLPAYNIFYKLYSFISKEKG